jgi:hypothetical protein
MILSGKIARNGYLAFFDERNLVRFPDTKSGPQMRVAGGSAMTVLEAQSLRSHSPYIFPADRGDGYFIGVVRVLGRVCARAGLEEVTPHRPDGASGLERASSAIEVAAAHAGRRLAAWISLVCGEQMIAHP